MSKRVNVAWVLIPVAIVANSQTRAGVTFTDQATFVGSIASTYYAESYQSFGTSGHPNPWSFTGGTNGGITYQVSTTAQAFLVFALSGNNYLTTSGQPTTAWSAPITINFTGTPINAVGGNFFLTGANGAVVNSTITLSFSDGSTRQLANQSNSTFFGYISDTTITSLTLTPPATHHFVSIDNLHVGVIGGPPPQCFGDANHDGATNSGDLSILLSQFGTSVTPGTGADYNADGVVNGADLSVLLGAFGCD